MVRRHERLYSAMSYIENRGDIDLDKRYEKADFPRAPSRNSNQRLYARDGYRRRAERSYERNTRHFLDHEHRRTGML